MTLAFQLAVFALIATSSILLISVPVVFASPDGLCWANFGFLEPQNNVDFFSGSHGGLHLMIRKRVGFDSGYEEFWGSCLNPSNPCLIFNSITSWYSW